SLFKRNSSGRDWIHRLAPIFNLFLFDHIGCIVNLPRPTNLSFPKDRFKKGPCDTVELVIRKESLDLYTWIYERFPLSHGRNNVALLLGPTGAGKSCIMF